MNKKQEQATQKRNPFSRRRLGMILTILVALVISGALLYRFFTHSIPVEFSFNAAIVDQLGGVKPNTRFNETGIVATILEDAGFNVTYHGNQTVNVLFYKGLAGYNYGIVILRTHSAQREDETLVDLFTSERFDTGKYESELDNGLLTVGHYSWDARYYFTIPPNFIESLAGQFPKSIIVAMGCNTLNATCTEMAEAFIKKGAKAYIGWTGLVEASHTDEETVKLLRGFLVENKTLDQITRTAEPDPTYRGSQMTYYPSAAGNLTLPSLRAEKMATELPQSFNASGERFFEVRAASAVHTASKELKIKLHQVGLSGV